MTFDKWIDAVNAQVHARLGSDVRTQELSWDSAWWVGAGGHAAATMAEDGATANISCDGGDRLVVAFREADGTPERIGDHIADRLATAR